MDLIVMGTHGRRGLDRLVIGSVTERVLRNAAQPVVAVQKPSHDFISPDQRQDPVSLSAESAAATPSTLPFSDPQLTACCNWVLARSLL